MEIYLIRHAIAEAAAMGQDDAARPLTDEGRRRFARVAEQLAHAGVVFDRIYHSPKLRAVQTADLLRPLLVGEFEVTPLLAAPPDKETSACSPLGLTQIFFFSRADSVRCAAAVEC